jgi:hypothetical protein
MDSTEINAGEQYFSDVNTRIRDIEEKQRLLKDRTLLIGKNLIEDRENLFEDMQEIKKELILLKSENLKMQEFLKKVSNQISQTARKEELMILQRQFDLFREK